MNRFIEIKPYALEVLIHSTMTSPIFVNIEKRAGLLSFLRRQLFEEPTLPRDVDLKGRTVVITGSNTGIGFECARQLLDLGTSKLIMAVHDESKEQKERSTLLSCGSSFQENSVEVWKLGM